MSTTEKAKNQELVEQEHCIDLPGESVQCWIGGGTDKLKVILRKHRDVLFDIHLGNGKIYTVESTESDFYNPRDKKLVFAAQNGKVTFKDGERMHLWISRGFRGALILKQGNEILSRIEPNNWDNVKYSDDPAEKPAPIIISLSNNPSSSRPLDKKSKSTVNTSSSEEQIYIHEVSDKGAPPAILKFFQDGGESLHLDTMNIITRNWITGQIAGIAGYVFDNRTWITELKGCSFRLQRVVHNSGPKMYMIFTGNNKLRELMSASRYSMKHPKVMKITGGGGDVKQAWEATKGAAKDSVKVFAKEEEKKVVKGAGIVFIFTIAMDTAEWYKDYSEVGSDGKPKKDLFDLCAKLGTDLTKTAIVGALTTASVALAFGCVAAITGTLAAPVLLVVAGTIAVAFAWSFVIEKVDKASGHALGEDDTTMWLAKRFRESAHFLSQASKDSRYANYFAAPILSH